MKKQIMSIAAAAAIFTTGAMAFDTYNDALATDASGVILTSSYTSATLNASAIEKSTTQKGDALIYPLFTQADGYSSEIVVRNTSNEAVVAKVALYGADGSKELRDFNIYLSGHDVFRFTIANGKLTSTDDSVRVDGITPSEVNTYVTGTAKDKDDYHSIKFGSEASPLSPAIFDKDEQKKGYVIIYGMVQATSILSGLSDVKGGFHKKHDSLYAAYAKLLDDLRGETAGATTLGVWRNLKDASVRTGSLFIKDVLVAPNVALPAVPTEWKKGTTTLTTQFKGVEDVLTGHVRLTQADNGTDMILPATAISNFSDDAAGNTALWTEGEYASLADKCIDAVGGIMTYEQTCLQTDANVFNVSTAVYTYANKANDGAVDNRIYITQPYKRTMIQLGMTTGYQFNTTKTSTKVETGTKSYFTTTADVYDEKENKSATQTTTGPIFSGDDTVTVDPTKYASEVQMIKSDAFDQSEQDKDTFGKLDGFANFNVGVPAIITQMVATKAGTSVETNWIYSDTTK